MSILSKAEDALRQANALILRNGGSRTNQAALARIKEDARAIIAEAKPAPIETPPTPEPEPTPTSVADLRPWVTPIETTTTIGESGKSTVLKPGTYENVLFKGQVKVESGAVILRRCLWHGPHGMGDGGTLLYILGGSVVTEYCEFTGSEGRSGIYQHGGVWTPHEIWVHDNGVGRGAEFQQVYVGAGEIRDGHGGLIEDGPDYGFQAYNSPTGTDKVTHIDWDGLRVRGCRHGCMVLSHRVSDAKLTNVVCDGTGAEYGVLAYNLEGTNNSVSGHVWGAKKNYAQTGSGIIETSGVLQTAV